MNKAQIIAACAALVVASPLSLLVMAYYSPPGPNHQRTCARDANTIVFTEMPGSHNHHTPRQHVYKKGDRTIDVFSVFDSLEPAGKGKWKVHFTNKLRGEASTHTIPSCDKKL